MDFYEEDLSSFSFLCCFRFLSNGVPSLLLLFLFCLIGLANTKIQFGLCHSACKKYIVIAYMRLFIVSFLLTLNVIINKIKIFQYNIVVCDKLD